jgi:two-component system sensor histidine kinase/response regulator
MTATDSKNATAKILIAEDQEDILENLADYLSMLGYEVLQAKDGIQAFNLALDQKPDLIISDLGMPVWSGHRLLEEMQGHPILSQIPFIILTAWADRPNMRRCLQSGAVDYITKPFSLSEIDEAVKSHLRRKQQLDKRTQSLAINKVIPDILRHFPHELRTPLNGILSPSEMLMDLDSTASMEQVTHLGDIINISTLRLLRVVENITLFLAVKPEPEPIKKRPSTSETIYCSPMKIFQRICEKTIRRRSFPENRLYLRGVIKRDCKIALNLEKVFEEVLDNACQFSDPETNVQVEWVDMETRASLTITNEGPGMTKEQLDQIGPFQQYGGKKMEQEGLGLGLFIALELAKHNEAQIEISSSKSGPTQVQITFPLYPASGH